MIATRRPEPPTRAEAARLLADTARAVKAMKASWLHVALNLRAIREHELWRYASPPCESYERYVLDVLQLNRHVAHRMLLAMEYTEEHRPRVVEDFHRRGDVAEVPALDVVDRLRRVERSFEGRESDLDELRSRVFDDGVGRVVLQREIERRLGAMDTGSKVGGRKGPPPTIEGVIGRLLEVEKQLAELEVAKEARALLARVIELLRRGGG
jgi:hypothetical protein